MVAPVNPWPPLILLVTLIGVAPLVATRWSAPLTGWLHLYRKEERGGHDVDVCVIKIPLHGRFRMESLAHVDTAVPDSAAKIFVMAHRGLRSGVVRLRVGIRFTALRRGAIREM